jgi:hypothetical protein
MRSSATSTMAQLELLLVLLSTILLWERAWRSFGRALGEKNGRTLFSMTREMPKQSGRVYDTLNVRPDEKRLLACIMLALCAPSCGRFVPVTSATSPAGVTAFLSRNNPAATDGYSYTICLSEEEISSCSQTKAVFVAYRPKRIGMRWVAPDLLEVHQSSGEVWKHERFWAVPLANGGNRQVRVRLVREA